MQITITDKIVDPCNEDENYHRIEFTCFNDADVSLIDSLSVAQACFLYEHNQLQEGAFKDMIRYICTTDYSEIEIDKVFE